MQFHYQSVDVVKRFIPSTFSSRFLIRGEGDIVSGWAVANIEVITRNFTLGEELDFFISNYGTFSVSSVQCLLVRTEELALVELMHQEPLVSLSPRILKRSEP